MTGRRHPITGTRHSASRAATVVGFDGGKGLFEGWAVRYGVVDDYRTVFTRGCFSAALDDPEQDPPSICLGHAWTDVVGRVVATDDRPEGLWIVGQLDRPDSVPSARKAWAQLLSGSVQQLSVGFRRVREHVPTAAEQAQYPGADTIFDECLLDEVSLVLRAAVPGSKVLATRAGTRSAGPLVTGGARRVSGWDRPGALVDEIERRRKMRRTRA